MKNKPSHYPNLTLVRAQLNQAAAALEMLAHLGVRVNVVRFRTDNDTPKIEVAHCPAVAKFADITQCGRGRNESGKLYVRKITLLLGCLVQWDEVL